MNVVEFVGLFTVLIFFGVFAALAVDHIRHESTYDPDRHICCLKEVGSDCTAWRHKTYCELHPEDEEKCVCDEFATNKITKTASVWEVHCVSLYGNLTSIFNWTVSPSWIIPVYSLGDNWSCEMQNIGKTKMTTGTVKTCIKAHARQS